MLYLISGTWYLTPALIYYTWHLISGTWYLTPVLDIYYLTPDTWHMISDTGTWHVFTWHLIPDTWYMTFDNWHAITHLTCYHLVLVHLTDIVTPDWILLHLTPVLPYIFMIITLRELGMIIILLPDIWYSWTSVLLNFCILESLKKGDSWYYPPNIVLLLIPVIG